MEKPVRQKSRSEDTGLVQRVIADIRQLIRDQGLQAGDTVPSETALSEQFEVSRAVVREAMRALSALRILDVGNGRRARVAAPDATATSMIIDHTAYTGQLSIQQILDVRRTLELRTAHLAALRRSDEQAQDLLHLTEQMLASIEEQEQIRELDIRFHELIAECSGNPLYSILVGSFRGITEQTWHIGWHSRGTLENRRSNVECHARIAQAIAGRDPAAATQAMTEHFDSATLVLLNAGVI